MVGSMSSVWDSFLTLFGMGKKANLSATIGANSIASVTPNAIVRGGSYPQNNQSAVQNNNYNITLPPGTTQQQAQQFRQAIGATSMPQSPVQMLRTQGQ